MHLFYYINFNFVIYSFIGWIIEELYGFVINKTFKKENFLLMPVKPMYGIAMTILSVLYYVYDSDKFSLVILCFLVPTTVEYISGYILKHVFNKLYWSYSEVRYNLYGYVCLKFSIYWGVLSFIGIRFFQPILNNIFINSPIYYITSMMAFLIAVDFMFTIKGYADISTKK